MTPFCVDGYGSWIVSSRVVLLGEVLACRRAVLSQSDDAEDGAGVLSTRTSNSSSHGWGSSYIILHLSPPYPTQTYHAVIHVGYVCVRRITAHMNWVLVTVGGEGSAEGRA